MMRIENIRDRRYSTDGEMFAVVDLQVSTAAELPALGDTVDGAQVQAGSIAQIIQTGQWATLDEDGTWYDSDGNAMGEDNVSTANVVPNLSLYTRKPAENITAEPEEDVMFPLEGDSDADIL